MHSPTHHLQVNWDLRTITFTVLNILGSDSRTSQNTVNQILYLADEIDMVVCTMYVYISWFVLVFIFLFEKEVNYFVLKAFGYTSNWIHFCHSFELAVSYRSLSVLWNQNETLISLNLTISFKINFHGHLSPHSKLSSFQPHPPSPPTQIVLPTGPLMMER